MRKIQEVFVSLAIVLVLLLSGLTGVTTAAPPHQSGDLQTIADDITRDVGRVIEVQDNGSAVPVFLFQENHMSILGQNEHAIMLNRLITTHGTTHVGLEGAFDLVDLQWYHNLPGEALRRASIGVQLLVEGEISNAEFIALAHPTVQVIGIENQDEYKANHETPVGSGSILYLIYFSLFEMTDDQQNTAIDIVNNEGADAFFEYSAAYDPVSAELYAGLNNAASVEELVTIVDEIAAKAAEYGMNDMADFDDLKADLAAEREFYALASQRSRTMIDKIMGIVAESGGPVPVIIGSLHTQLMKTLLSEAGYSYVVIEAASLQAMDEQGQSVGSFSDFAYERKSERLSVDGLGQLGAILDGRDTRIKPWSSVETVLVKRKLLTYWAFDWLAGYTSVLPLPAASAGPVPYGLGDVLNELDAAGFVINRNSIEFVPADPDNPNGPTSLFFEVTLPQDSDDEGTYSPVTFWSKTTRHEADAELLDELDKTDNFIEPLLLAAHRKVSQQSEDVADVQPSATEAEPVEAPADPRIPVSIDTIATVGLDSAEVRERKI